MSNPFCSDDDYPEPSAYDSSSFYTGLFKSGGPYCDGSDLNSTVISNAQSRMWVHINGIWNSVLEAKVNVDGEWL